MDLYMKLAILYVLIAMVFVYLYYSKRQVNQSLTTFYTAPTVLDKQNIGVL
jgi:uncharacterized membrane protein YukC